MATNTIIQNLNTELYSAYPGGSTESVPTSSMNRRQTETFWASAAIVAGDFVALDFSKTADGDKALYVLKSDAASGQKVCVVGVALAGAASGEKVEVCIAGICDANVDAATVAGSMLGFGATAGRAAIITNTDVKPIVAIACEADTANIATVCVLKQF